MIEIKILGVNPNTFSEFVSSVEQGSRVASCFDQDECIDCRNCPTAQAGLRAVKELAKDGANGTIEIADGDVTSHVIWLDMIEKFAPIGILDTDVRKGRITVGRDDGYGRKMVNVKYEY